MKYDVTVEKREGYRESGSVLFIYDIPDLKVLHPVDDPF